MHEMSLMAGMMEIIQDEARDQGFARVTKVVLEIGQLAGVEPEAMRFAFDVCTEGSVAEGADLEIEATEGLARCVSCARTFPVRACYGTCPFCAGADLRIVSGREMRLKFLDVE